MRLLKSILDCKSSQPDGSHINVSTGREWFPRIPFRESKSKSSFILTLSRYTRPLCSYYLDTPTLTPCLESTIPGQGKFKASLSAQQTLLSPCPSNNPLNCNLSLHIHPQLLTLHTFQCHNCWEVKSRYYFVGITMEFPVLLTHSYSHLIVVTTR